jgi:hypothetical protein
MIISMENKDGERGFIEVATSHEDEAKQRAVKLVNQYWAGEWRVIAWGNCAPDESFELRDLAHG